MGATFSQMCSFWTSPAESDKFDYEKHMSRPHLKDWPNDAGFTAEIEHVDPIELEVQGTIPAYAAGTLYRTGPGTYVVKDSPKGDFALSHWFDGFSHLYRFEIQVGKDDKPRVFYNSRAQVDRAVQAIRDTGKYTGVSFGQKRDPCMSFFAKVKAVWEPMYWDSADGVNVGVTVRPNVGGYENITENPSQKVSDSRFENLICYTDSKMVKAMDPDTLAPIGVTTQNALHPELKGPLSCAHPEYDPITGDCYNYNLEFGKEPKYRVFKHVAATNKTEILATISGKDIKTAYVHSIFLTEDYVILAIWPSHFRQGGAAVLWTRNIMDAIGKFDPNAKTKWLVVDRTGKRGHIATYDSPAMFCFHTVNAWQEKQEDGTEDLICDIVEYENLDTLHALYYDGIVSNGPETGKFLGKNRPKTALARYKLGGISASTANAITSGPAPRAEKMFKLDSPHMGDLPTWNPRWAMKKTRYIYSVLDRGESSFVDSLVKTDADTLTSTLWAHPHHTPGEAIFIVNPDGHDEDDGVVLSVVLDGDKRTSYLLCLDARNMKEIGRVEVPCAVGFGFHGNHIPY